MSEPTEATGDLRTEYYRRISRQHLTPLWEVLHSLVPKQPSPTCVTALWRYQDLRPVLMEAGELISAKEATRRVLILENPAHPGQSRITNTLYAGLQLLKPGEIAPAHRHSQSALRFVLEGKGAFTSVDGERHYMSPGDLVLTPAWTWHDHGGESGEPVIWLDGLDIPIVRTLDAGFAEDMQTDQQPVARPDGDCLVRYGANMVPVDYRASPGVSPMFVYPYERTREALYRMAQSNVMHEAHGYKMRYINPTTGGHVLPTISTFMQVLPRGFSGRAYRSTDATIFVAVEGRGRTIVGGEAFDWGPRDVFVVPSWSAHRHEAQMESVLFSFSDRVIHEQLGLWRESYA